jgi:5-methylcytosine-specific restriction endonuclease McrA
MSRKHIQATAYNLKRTDQMFARAYRNDAWVKQGKKCEYCLNRISEEAVTADHLRSRARGGSTERQNIKAACHRCNLIKGPLSEKEFKRLLDSRDIPVNWQILEIWLNRRLEKKLAQALVRLCKYTGMPREASA